MGEEVKLKLIFANEVANDELSITLNTSVKDVKKNIMENKWNPQLTPIENVERIRLFVYGREVGGKEADNKSLKDSNLPRDSSGNIPPIHVVTVLKSTETTSEKETQRQKSSTCSCTLL
mmetsp:Transcript_99706/g.157821  ORF Transcript_99706/g.157821 Transcript_99706/m.157821 type:complete len:119 (-) Transcript_99706:42-398(-)|eukprot:CAMPEP_0169151992 /NCGR_PEP_ID=MMETSP1015-20121227/51197_1 /TAXON_ID=342587 /ORGANISM="Karlodinium micrum, Strain CCMP2283" /LENGTH=118 /DNA_ID=CAMNT_0009221599 /DNA_START=164 /DNA_END=520 /DNA_ORIENTATION=+